MKKVVVKQEKMKQIINSVPTGEFINKTRYETIDGLTFDAEIDALRHEAHLRMDTMCRVEHEIPELGSVHWYKAKDEEELEFYKKWIPAGWCSKYGLEDLKVGEWFTYRYEDGGDYSRDSYWFITLTEYMQAVHQMLAEMCKK